MCRCMCVVSFVSVVSCTRFWLSRQRAGFVSSAADNTTSAQIQQQQQQQHNRSHATWVCWWAAC